MKITINQRELEYQPDYPNGWKFSAGDPFKYPVLIGEYQCFIKRIEQPTPEEIPGWHLLVKMAGKYEKNLSRIYDIKNVQEEGKEIYYVFYEFLDGSTLENNPRQKTVNLTHLNDDLFNAIRALQKFDYWFSDFTEKNIFYQKDGSFVLVDLDSAQRISAMPDNEMYGSKDYWILVFKFYKEVLNKQDIRLSDINGATLNYLQIPFLVLRHKQLINGIENHYNSTELFNQLPSQLIEMVPEFREIYLNVIKNGREALSPEIIRKIEETVDKKIIKAGDVPAVLVSTVSQPVIKEFKTSSRNIISGGTFNLTWQVENTDKLELHKNGAMFKALDISEKQVALKEFADGTRQESSFRLYAYKGLEMAKSAPIIVHLKEEEHETRSYRKAGIVILSLIALGALSFFLYRMFSPSPGEFYINQKILRQGIDSTITIYSHNLPAKNLINIAINDTLAQIGSANEDSLVVLLPVAYFGDSNYTALVTLNINNQIHTAGSFTYLPHLETWQQEVYEEDTLTFYGEGLNTNSIKVLFGNQEAAIVSSQGKSLIVKVPALKDTIAGHSIPIMVVKNDYTIFSSKFVVRYDTVKLLTLAPDALWVSGEVIDGKSKNDADNLPWQGELTDGNGFARIDSVKLENEVAYRVLRTHPKWVSNGIIRGFFPMMEIQGKKAVHAKIGFVENGRSLDGVTFQVWVYYQINNQDTAANIIRELKLYEGTIKDIRASMPNEVNEFSIELRVDCGVRSESDWAAWINPVIVSRKLVATSR